jgi:hypothetical protein
MRLVKLARWIWGILAAIAAGTIVRLLRRVARRPPRIVHGTYPMHMTRDMVRADRRAGFESHAIVTHTELAPYPLVTNADFDVVLQATPNGLAAHWKAALYILRHADIWVTYFDSVFSGVSEGTRDDRLFRLMRLLGIRIVATPNGLDVAHVLGRRMRFDWIERLQRDYPAWDLLADTPQRLERNARVCRHASFVIADPQTSQFLTRADALFKYFPIERPNDDPGTVSGGSPTIVHAPNHRWLKGTDDLQRALAWLEEGGFHATLDLVEKTPRADALARYARADIVADQFRLGSYGVFALEALSLGKPVLCYLDEEHLGNPVFNLGILNANPHNLPFVLAPLLRIPALRKRVGDSGREMVTRYQSLDALAEVFTQIYNHVWFGTTLELDRTRHFGHERKPRAFTENPAQESFWPVPVDDLIVEIRDALLQAGMKKSEFTGTKPVFHERPPA